MSTNIQFISGDATQPVFKKTIIAHVCNDIGAWGSGFVIAVSNKWKLPEFHYRKWYIKNDGSFKLGEVQYVTVSDDVIVANMIAQHGIRSRNNAVPLDYQALRACLANVFKRANELTYSIQMPRIGCGLAGGNWNQVQKIIEEESCDFQQAVSILSL